MPLTQGSPLPNITTNQTQTTTAPTWYNDYLSNLAGQSTAAAGNAQYVGAQPLQQMAFQAAGALPGTYQPQMQAATNLATNVGNTDVAQRAGEFMNPYTNNVVNALDVLGKRNINEYLAPQATAAAVGAGQFGSKRGAEALGGAVNIGLQNLNAAQAQALQTGYGQSLQAAQADQSNKLNAASTMGNLATAGQNMGLADINALATMGGQQQTIGQNAELFPLQALNAASQNVRGFTVPTSTTSSYTGPIPGAYSSSPLAQIAGLGSLVAGASDTNLGKGIGRFIGTSFGGTYDPATDIMNFPAGNPFATGEYSDPGYWT